MRIDPSTSSRSSFTVRMLLRVIAQICCGLLYSLALMPSASCGFDGDLETDIRSGLKESKVIVATIQNKLKSGVSITADLNSLKSVADNIRQTHLRLEERFNLREEKAIALGTRSAERHQSMAEGYGKALREYLGLVEDLLSGGQEAGASGQENVEKFKSLLEKMLPNKNQQIIGSLPYRHLNVPANEPSAAPSITPAYRGGNKTVSPDDTESAPEAPLSEEIVALAQSLNWQPVAIYEYVKNTVETEWYWGCMKGAEETLHQKSGNDCDQAALLIALLRASGFPTRYVRGTVEIFASDGKTIERAEHLTGVNDPARLAEFFQKAGIPYTAVIQGGAIAGIRFEHIYVESLIPYANYRGIVIDNNGKTWLGLDTSIKVKGYQYNSPPDIYQEPGVSSQLSAMRDGYLGLMSSVAGSTPFELNQTPLEYLQSRINSELSLPSNVSIGGTLDSELSYSDFLRTRTLVPETLNILPGSMQITLIKATNEYTELPEELKHKIRFIAKDRQNNELLNITRDTYELTNKQITFSYEPETVEDQETIDAHGGLDNTPAYLVRLRPVVKIDGERIAVAQDGLPMGSEYDLTMELYSPSSNNGNATPLETITSNMITGNLTAVGIVAQKAVVAPSPLAEESGEENDAERLLYNEAVNHIDRWNKAEDELSSLLHLVLARPLPAVVIVGNVFDITYLLGVPQGLTWKGVFVDALSRTVETVMSDVKVGSGDEREHLFMQLSALQGSILENRIFEDDFKVASISTAKLFQTMKQGSGGGVQGSGLLTIDRTNIAALLPTLTFNDSIKEDITNAVNQNLAIRIPHSALTYQDWTGIGYVKEKTDTAESGWMLSGSIAGGMTAVSPGKWPDQSFIDILRSPYQSNDKTVVITYPQNDETVTTTAITVTGTIVDTTSSVTVNGVKAEIQGNNFSANIRLVSGANKITATASTTAGVKTTDTIVITCSIPVKVYITYPYDGAELGVSPITVEGIVSDPSVSVTVNNKAATVTSDGRFVANAIALTEGTNLITATATNKKNETDSNSISVNYHAVQTSPTLTISITTPTTNAAINKPATTVIGAVTTTAGEAWIVLNGIPAVIYGNQFVVNDVPLTNGSNRIIVNAIDSNGAMARAETTVIADITQPYVQLSANITSGIAPMTTYFTISTSLPNPVATYQIDFEGDGVVDYTGTAFDNVSHTYTAEGIFNPKITITDIQGKIYTDTIAIAVLNKTTVDVLLKSKWDGMKAKLTGQDVGGATSYFISTSRDRYAEVFTALGDRLPQIVQNMRDVQLIYVKNNSAKYRIRKDELYGGQPLPITYYIYFAVDKNGMWKIIRF